MPQPMKNYRIHILDECGKEKGRFLARFPEVPQVGWILVFDNAPATPRGFIDVEGVVTNVLMMIDCPEVQVYIKETKA